MKISETQIQLIGSILREDLMRDLPLKNLTSYRIGGPADIVGFPKDSETFVRLLKLVRNAGIPHFVLGNGTNVLFHDEGFRGLIISPLKMRKLGFETNYSSHTHIVAECGASLPGIVARSCRSGLAGMEPLWGIPGSIGGSIACNAGANGVSIGDFVEEIELVNREGERIFLRKGSFEYGYRFCNLPPRAIILKSRFKLLKSDPDHIHKKLEVFKGVRRSTQPRGFPNAGCVFKNPAKDLSAGALIERLGFKGMRCGGAEVSPVHANFIINRDKAKASHIMELIDRITEAAYKREGINLKPEIRIVNPGENNV
ncbi:MAG: UDP-N-acetylmuramate dehydrogenase [Desulfomonilaceae bacterium]